MKATSKAVTATEQEGLSQIFAAHVARSRFDQLSARAVEAVKKSGKVTLVETVTVSPDGKTLTSSYHGTDAIGRQVTAVAVFEKQ